MIESAEQTKSYIGGHTTAGIASYVVSKGLLLVPVQNIKTRMQFGIPSYMVDSKYWWTGLGTELGLQFLGFGVKVGLNSLLNKADIHSAPSALLDAVSNVVVFPLAKQRVTQVFEESHVHTTPDNSWSNWLASVGGYVLHGLLEDYLQSVIYDKLVGSNLLPIDVDSSVHSERLVQGISLGCAKVILSPLELIYKNQMVYGGRPKVSVNNVQALYRGAQFGMLEGISLIYIKYTVFKSLTDILVK